MIRRKKTTGPEDAPLATGQVLTLVACLGLVLAPHGLRLPAWMAAFAAATIALRAGFAWRGYGLPNKWILALLALAAAAGTWLSYGMLFGRDAAVGLLVMMLCLKLMELRTARDGLFVLLLAYFAIITNFLYSQSLSMGLYLLACVWFITAYLIGMHKHSARRPVSQLLRQSAVMLAQAAPLMLVFFFLFPRVHGPLWALPQASGTGVTGLSDRMAPGSLSSLSLSDAVAFRAEFDSPPPLTSKLYWRGPVMWDFDGRTWSVGDTAAGYSRDLRGLGTPVGYWVTIEPHNMRWLLGLDVPAERPELGILTTDSQVLSLRPVRTRQRYHMSSYLDYRVGIRESRASVERALRLPEGFNPMARALAAEWRDEGLSPDEVVARALALFRDKPFFYTLVPPELGTHGIDDFLFRTRRGFCEHYASSFVFLLRSAGIPARVVTGYQGGVINPVGGYMIVRQADAHAWAEAWLPDRGWVRIDPTAAVSPRRIEMGVAAALPASDPLPLMMRTDNEWLKRARFALDTVTNGWNQWVLGYSPERQMSVLSMLLGSQASWRTVAAALIGVTLFVVAVLAFVSLRRLARAPKDPVVASWDRLSSKLAPLGLARRPDEGPLDYVRRARSARPDLADQLDRIGQLYARLRYGAGGGDPHPSDLARAVRSLRVSVPRTTAPRGG